jgi:hypothetical protein
MEMSEFDEEMRRIEAEYDAREEQAILELWQGHTVKYVRDHDNWACSCGATLESFNHYALHVIRAARE